MDALLSNLGRMVAPAVEKLTGQKADSPAQMDALADAIASNPAALQAIADALAARPAAPVRPAPPVPVVVSAPAPDKKR